MAIETEKKYRLSIDEREKVFASLKELNAEFTGQDFEVNEIYGGGILAETKSVLRVRKIDKKTILTYKKRLAGASPVKQQVEYETEVSDAETLAKIIESLGFEKLIVYEKRRQKWNFNHCEVVLDELPFGMFMEIEGKHDHIGLTEILLEAENFQVEHETYPGLTKKLGIQNGAMIEARF
jgi:adenylate cyclase class 2